MTFSSQFKLCQSALSKGFTLIELVIVIIILSAVGIATTSYIATGLDIYNDITERDKSINSVRFVMERMHREVSNALPNSAKSFANPDGDDNQCLSFYPIKKSSFYTDFPIYPLQSSEGSVATISDYDYVTGDRAVVYLLHEAELASVETNGSAKSQAISSVNAAKDKLFFSSSVSFPLSSPASRVYIINDIVKYCFLGTDLYRQKNAETAVLMGENIAGTFNVIDATLQRNSLVKIGLSLVFDGQEVAFEKTLHINNVP
ncbi:prepilin-type N-terminal cleavage/methylation domain-containing protein [Psychromonas sp.]|nr:prepilin-type N-terminal cleavage/methylation domain-containing protein [Psychromonas sp.]